MVMVATAQQQRSGTGHVAARSEPELQSFALETLRRPFVSNHTHAETKSTTVVLVTLTVINLVTFDSPIHRHRHSVLHLHPFSNASYLSTLVFIQVRPSC